MDSSNTYPDTALFEFLLGTGDDLLVLGHRLSEWCGHAPILEEDIALANIALDCLGQASAFLQLAAEVEGKNHTEDDLVYLRDVIEYKNLLISELPKGDFAFTIVRQFLFDTFYFYYFDNLKTCNNKLAGIAEKSFEEIKYHLRHTSEWIIRLGDGTEESHKRTQKAFDDLWMYTGEFFEINNTSRSLIDRNIIQDYSLIKPLWETDIINICKKATLNVPDNNQFMLSGGRKGMHTEHLGHLLSDMQILARSYPEVKW
jgi:ring-1,2-phenylacetyl-CoA epoxidase subunit PaaC